MNCHQKDLVKVYKDIKDSPVNSPTNTEHLTYQLIYFQNKYRQKTNKVVTEKELRKAKRQPSPDISPSSVSKSMLKQLFKRKLEELTLLENTHHIKIFEAESKSNFIHGIGLNTIQEIAISIHPVYGIPYIPASSVKGIVRSWVNLAFFEGKLKDSFNPVDLSEEDQFKQGIFYDLFGTESSRGLAQFHDIYVPDYQVKSDIITNHYTGYYQKQISPSDYDPNLISHVNIVDIYSVETDQPVTIFVTLLNHASRRNLSGLPSEKLMNLLEKWVPRALNELGVGAKTSVGFGVFTNFKDITEDTLQRITEERKEKEEEERMLREKERIASLPEDEQLIYRIKQLDPKDEEDIGLSKHPHKIYGEVLKYPKAAPYLKEFWKETGDWTPRRAQRGQREKVDKIKELLGEED